VSASEAAGLTYNEASLPDAWQVAWHTNLDAVALHAGLDVEQAPDLFHTLPWFQHLHRCGIAPSEGLAVARVATPDGRGFLLPLQRQRGARAAVFGLSLTSLSNYYSSLYGAIGKPEACTPEACRALARSLRSEVADSAVLDLQPLDAQGPLMANLPAALQAEGYAVDTYFCFGNWYLPVEGRTWAQIEAGLPSRQRNTIKRARKKLSGAGAWTLKIHHEPGAELEQAIADYQAIYARSWKQPEPFKEFVPGLCRWAAARGWLRLGVVRLDDTPIAAQIWFVQQRKALIFKLAYDETYRQLSAGSVLTADLMCHAIDVDHALEVDYLTGDDAYKADWMTHRRERRGLVAFRKTAIRGIMAGIRHRLGKVALRFRPASAAA